MKRKQTHLNSVSHSKYVALNTSEPDTRGLLRHYLSTLHGVGPLMGQDTIQIASTGTVNEYVGQHFSWQALDSTKNSLSLGLGVVAWYMYMYKYNYKCIYVEKPLIHVVVKKHRKVLLKQRRMIGCHFVTQGSRWGNSQHELVGTRRIWMCLHSSNGSGLHQNCRTSRQSQFVSCSYATRIIGKRPLVLAGISPVKQI